MRKRGADNRDDHSEQRIKRERANVQRQIDEDTCEEHNVFCCPLCTDQTVVEREDD